jgi:tRNA(Arg) A34 adenosine deaminase TadA
MNPERCRGPVLTRKLACRAMLCMCPRSLFLNSCIQKNRQDFFLGDRPSRHLASNVARESLDSYPHPKCTQHFSLQKTFGIEHKATSKVDFTLRTMSMERRRDEHYLKIALHEAKIGMKQGGIPIGSCLVDEKGNVLGAGHNQRMQKGSATLHGEMDALENAGRLPAAVLRRCTLYTTLSPCAMCSGAILLYKIGRVVVGENEVT